MSNMPDYVEKARIGFIIREMRAEELGALRLAVLGLVFAIVVMVAIVGIEHYEQQYLSEVIRGALRGLFDWVDAWR